jgi:hypothetical protein
LLEVNKKNTLTPRGQFRCAENGIDSPQSRGNPVLVPLFAFTRDERIRDRRDAHRGLVLVSTFTRDHQGSCREFLGAASLRKSPRTETADVLSKASDAADAAPDDQLQQNHSRNRIDIAEQNRVCTHDCRSQKRRDNVRLALGRKNNPYSSTEGADCSACECAAPRREKGFSGRRLLTILLKKTATPPMHAPIINCRRITPETGSMYEKTGDKVFMDESLAGKLLAVIT